MNLARVILAGAVCASSVIAGPRMAGSPQIPFSFVENWGQAGPNVRYIGNGPSMKAWFRANGVTFQRGAAHMSVTFSRGSSNPEIEASAPLGATANYFRGADPARWERGLPLYTRLTYRNVWDGIDVRFRADNASAKAEYIIAPGASLENVHLDFDGDASVQHDGSLLVRGESGEFREDRPFLFQEQESGRVPVDGGFVVYEDGTVGFRAQGYDRRKPLIIDPLLVFSGYFGDASEIEITSVAVNSYYNIVVAGWTLSTDLPTSGGAVPNNGGGVDAFVAGFSPTGGSLLFCTYLGGSGDDRAFGVTVDSANNTYVTGYTSSTNFPLANPFQSRLGGTRDAFVTKLNPAGSALIFSTYLGGSGVDTGNAITLDLNGDPVIVGDTTSTNLPVTAGVFQSKPAGNQDVFVAKLSPSGNAVTFLTYFGGSGIDHGAAVFVDSTNTVFFAGSTYSTNLPVALAAQPHSGGGQDGFLARLSSDGRTLLLGTYYGGSGGTASAPEEINSIYIRPGGKIIVAGTTSSTNFPIVSPALQPAYGGGNTDGFIGRFSATTGALQASTYLGGSSDDGINAVVADFYGYIYVAGYTTSSDFPMQNPIQSAPGGAMDAFVVKTISNKLLYSTYLGGSGNDSANALAVDSLTSVVVAGTTSSGNFPVSGNLEQYQGGEISSFITKISGGFVSALVAEPEFLYDIWHDTGFNGPNITLTASSFGQAGDIPVAADWDGSGVQRIGVFRNGLWLLDINGDGVFDAGDKTVNFGQAGDLPVIGDWNGTGVIKLGLFRQGTFILDLSGHLSGVPTGLSDATFPFGRAGDLPVAADWNQSGTYKVGVFRSGSWIVDYSGTHLLGAAATYSYGQAGDIPVIGDWDGDGVRRIGVYRQGLWILDYGGYNAMVAGTELIFGFGSSGYVPLVL
jgi:hypothetical protein